MSYKFYKLEQDGEVVVGSGFIIPDGFIEYSDDNLPTELKSYFDAYNINKENQAEIGKATKYLRDTDWVEPYLFKHSLGIETLSPDSNKLVIARLREEAKETIRLRS